MKVLYGVYIIRQTYAQLACQTSVATTQNDPVEQLCSPTFFRYFSNVISNSKTKFQGSRLSSFES